MNDLMPFGKFKGWPVDLLVSGVTSNDKYKPLNIAVETGVFTQISYLTWFDEEVKSSYEVNKIKQIKYSMMLINILKK